MLPAGLPMDSQKTAAVVSSISASRDSGRSSTAKRTVDALLGQDMGEQGVGGAVELGGGHDGRARRGDVAHRVPHRGHARGQCQSAHAAFERRHALLEHVDGGVVDPVVVKTRRLQIEDRGGVIGVDEIVGDGLVDGHRHGPGGIGVVVAVDGDRLVAHNHLPCP